MDIFVVANVISEGQASSGSWLTAPTTAAALLTSLFTVSGIVLKDYVLKSLEERRSEKRARIAVYERYSNPLVTATISLLNRLHEILHKQHRPVYLIGQGIKNASNPGGTFRAYKKLSTVYRLAVVLGWVRACRREFSYLRVADPGNARKVDKAIDDFEDALANGEWVEKERVSRLCQLWHLCEQEKLKGIESIEELGAKVDNLIWGRLEEQGLDDVSLMDEVSRLALCRSIADCLCSHLKTNVISDASMDRSWPDAFNIIGMREAWIYRDWQSAIGDIMILPTQGDTRKFEVMGYGDFEQMLSTGSEKQKVALARLLQIFDDLDFSIEDRFDGRPRQLRNIAKASAELILAIHEVQGNQSIVSPGAMERAHAILRLSK